jgi:hypothetical protein
VAVEALLDRLWMTGVPQQPDALKGGPMYAVVVRETGDREAIEGSGEHLVANVLPRTRQALGVVSAFWMTEGSGGTLNVLVFENEEAARAALEPIRNAPRPGFMKLESVDLYRVLAQF